MKQNPIYKAAAAAWAAKPSRPVYISTNDTAKLIRARLKAKFPGCKFSVRGHKYSGGSSIDVRWEDGPTAELVRNEISSFAGAGFDGMTDYQYSRGAWLMPNGSCGIREIEAHWGTEGDVVEAAVDGAIPVKFMADYVFESRSMSLAHMERSVQSYAKRYRGSEMSNAIERGEVGVEPSEWGGWKFKGNPCQFRNEPAPAGNYGGDTALSNYAGRRMRVA